MPTMATAANTSRSLKPLIVYFMIFAIYSVFDLRMVNNSSIQLYLSKMDANSRGITGFGFSGFHFDFPEKSKPYSLFGAWIPPKLRGFLLNSQSAIAVENRRNRGRHCGRPSRKSALRSHPPSATGLPDSWLHSTWHQGPCAFGP